MEWMCWALHRPATFSATAAGQAAHVLQVTNQHARVRLAPTPLLLAPSFQVKITMYPKASGNGITANPLMLEICKMAGIHDVGIKVHGSRNVRNAGKQAGLGCCAVDLAGLGQVWGMLRAGCGWQNWGVAAAYGTALLFRLAATGANHPRYPQPPFLATCSQVHLPGL